MQIAKFIIACVPLAVLASPLDLVDREASPDALVEVAGFSERRDDSNQLFGRNTDCKIIGSEPEVNCRESPNTASDVKIITKFKVGSSHSFKCRQKGSCVTVGKNTNCYWDKADRTLAKDCWVSGIYTDSKCTLASLGAC